MVAQRLGQHVIICSSNGVTRSLATRRIAGAIGTLVYSEVRRFNSMGSFVDKLSVREAFGFMLRGRRRVPEMRVGGVRVGVEMVSLVLMRDRERRCA